MGLMRKSTLAAAVLAAGFSASASADYLYGFANISINRLDWSDKTENRADKNDFTYLEIEGGAGFDWGEVYGFIDLENPHKSNSEGRATSMKGTIRYNLGFAGLNLYGHIHDLNGSGFYEQNRLLGVGFSYRNASLFFQPFLAVNNTESSNMDKTVSGFNGYVAGWVLGYSFKLMDQNFAFSNWNEYEFDRDSQYVGGQSGFNGAAALWWNVNDKITLGFQYRYANDKLGSATYQDGFIYSLKYNF